MKHVKQRFSYIKYKIIILIGLVLLFTFIYTFFDDSNFGGINTLQDIIKEEITKSEVKKKIESFKVKKNGDDNQDERALKETAQESIKDIKLDELKKENIKPSLGRRIFKRLYFSVITGTTLGYGDIYPISYAVKSISMIHCLSTIILILF